MRYQLTLVAVLVLLGTASAEGPTGEKVALLVGVAEYDHDKLDDLKFTERDVEDLAVVLRSSGYSRVVVLTARGGERLRPTLPNIRRELDGLLNKRTKRDTLLVALSGHGLQLGGEKDHFFCASDANPTRKDSLLSLANLYQELDNSGAGTKLLLVDACRNDPSAKGAKSVDEDNLPRPSKGTAALFSCAPSERSFEHVSWGHGAFFFTVLEGMRPDRTGQRFPADLDGDGTVMFDELSMYVRREVPDRVAKAINGAEQNPSEMKSLTGLVPLVRLAASASPRPQPRPRPGVAKETDNALVAKSALSMRLVRLEAGKFLMGSPATDLDAVADEMQHEVTLTKPFYLGETEVTYRQFQMFVNDKKYKTDAEVDKLGGYGLDPKTGLAQRPEFTWRRPGFSQSFDAPVVNVSWNDANAFCHWLSQKEGRTYRLPTEAEWEYACRAGAATRYSTGDDPDSLEGYANVADVALARQWAGVNWARTWYDSHAFTAPVRQFKPNAWGLYDMHGNVWEWCGDGQRTYAKDGATDPIGDLKIDDRVMRGGAWNDSTKLCRAAKRGGNKKATRAIVIGFRVAADVEGR